MPQNDNVSENVLWYDQLGMHDVDRVGGKTPRSGR
ncbi:hypothetical protein SODG_002197 [Sodalis praecaptivus]